MFNTDTAAESTKPDDDTSPSTQPLTVLELEPKTRRDPTKSP